MAEFMLMTITDPSNRLAQKVELEFCPRVGELVEYPETVKTHGTSLWRVTGVLHRSGGGTALTVEPS